MARDERVHSALQAEVDEVNSRFARIEQIKRFAILERDLTQDAGELTPTLKVKRNLIYDRYRQVFEDLYEAQNAPRVIYHHKEEVRDERFRLSSPDAGTRQSPG
jgi:long-chain acyl-CoA synthetase